MVSNASSAQRLPANVAAALARGNKIEAIKLLRQATGLGLAEAKHVIDAVSAIDGTVDAMATRPTHNPTLADVTAALQAGKKIEAIRLYREFAGVGLKEAKDAVVQMDQMTPPSAAAPDGLSPGQVPPSSGWVGWAVAAGLIAFAAYWWFGH
jgi:ribosomal protein L7/L12